MIEKIKKHQPNYRQGVDKNCQSYFSTHMVDKSIKGTKIKTECADALWKLVTGSSKNYPQFEPRKARKPKVLKGGKHC